MSAKIKVTRPTLARRKGGRPSGRSEIGKIQEDAKRGYIAACLKYGWKLPRKWQPRKVGNQEAIK